MIFAPMEMAVSRASEEASRVTRIFSERVFGEPTKIPQLSQESAEEKGAKESKKL